MLNNKIEQIAEEFLLVTNLGISIEIKDFFKEDERVNKYKMEIVENNRYKIIIELDKFSLQAVKAIFSEFLHFIEYSNMSFYSRSIKEKSIDYMLLTVNNDSEGVLFQLSFK